MFFLLMAAATAEDTPKRKTCESVRFCRENLRASASWGVRGLALEGGALVGDVFLDGADSGLVFRLQPLKSGGFRVRVEPKEQQRFRYDLFKNGHVVSQECLGAFERADGNKAFAGDVEVEVSEKLVIVFRERGSEVVRVNGAQQLLFELGGEPEKALFNGFTDEIVNGGTAVGVDVTFCGDSVRLSGLSERASPMNLADTGDAPLRLFNNDAFAYEADTPIPLYGSIPYVVAHSPSMCASVFWANPSDTYVDISTVEGERKCRFVSEGGFVDLVVFVGRFKSIMKEYCELTGYPAMPPLFALGYHQSRWGYATQHEVGIVMRGLDDARIPFDAMWLDLDHLLSKTPFTFNLNAFPGPQKLMSDLREHDRYLVCLCDPHLPSENDYQKTKDLRAKKFAVMKSSGSPFVGDAWPGACMFPDFMNPEVVAWWGQQFNYGYGETAENVFYWNDMNEPSIFKSDEFTFPKSCKHFGDIENREVHNLYGLMNTVGTHQGLLNRNPDHNTRPFVMTRSFFAGSQKFAWTWTGDNVASWEHLAISIPMVATLGLCGMPFAGADVGGFLKSPDGALLARWFQAGAWTYPFFREHCHHKTSRREPFMFDGEELQAMKQVVINRYKLLPLWYTASKISNETGVSPVTPLWVEFPEEESMHDVDNAVIVGQSLLVSPVLEDDPDEVEVVKPPGKWYRYPSGDELTEETTTIEVSLSDVPVFLRGGKIITTFSRVAKSACETLMKPITLYVALDDSGSAQGELYLDDGVTYNYQRGEYIRRTFTFSSGKLKSTGAPTQIPQALANTIIEKAIVFGPQIATIPINKKLSEDFEIDV